MINISIITINFNNSKGLEQTIQSVERQKNVEFEYVVIDGASTDGSVDVIKRHQEIISYWVSEKDGGIYEAMNKGVMASHGKYCLFLNSGDELVESNTLSKVIPYLNNSIDYVVGHELMTVKGISRYLWHSPHKCDVEYLIKYSLRHQASFIKRNMLITVPFDEQLRLVSDWKQMLVSFLSFEATYMSIPVVVDKCERIGATYNNKRQSLCERQSVLNQLFPHDNIIVTNPTDKFGGRFMMRVLHLWGFIEAKLFNLKITFL